MNKRIRELMLEAGFAAPELAGRANKFAELLVQDCVDMFNETDAVTGSFVKKVLKEHFGLAIADTDVPPYLRVKE